MEELPVVAFIGSLLGISRCTLDALAVSSDRLPVQIVHDEVVLVFFEIDHLKGRFHPPGGQSTGRPERGRFRWPSSLTLFTLWIRGHALEIHTTALRRFKPWPNHKLRRLFGQALSQND
jgi:hypothetical protein